MADEPLVIRVAANLDTLRANLIAGVNQIETTSTAMRQMATAYDGSRAISQAGATMAAIQGVGGATHLTADEQAKANVILQAAIDKYAALGRTAPAGMQALADATKQTNASTDQFGSLLERIAERLTIYAVLREGFSFAKEAIESTAKLEELSIATGISTDGLQRLGYVGKESGLDMEQLTRGVEQLSAKLAGGDKNATTAVELLGLNLEKLLKAGPEEAFLSIAEAVGRIDDPMTKAAIASDLWGGRLSKQLLPLLGELRQRMLDVPKDAIITDVNITKAHEFEVGLGHLEDRLKSWTVSILGGLSAYNDWLEKQSGVTAATDSFGRALPVTTKSLVDNTQAAEDSAATLIHLAQTVKEKIAADALEAEALKKFTAAMVEMNSAGNGWRGTLDTINGSVVEAIRFYLQAGVSQKSLADAYGVTAVQVKAVASALKDEQQGFTLEAKSLEETTKLWDEYNALRVSHGGTANDQAIAQIDKWAADLTAKMSKAGTDTNDFYDALAAVSKEKMAAVGVDWTFMKSHSLEALQEMADNARATYEAMITSSDHFTRTVMDEQLKKWKDLEYAAHGWGAAVAAASTVATAALQGVQTTMSMAQAAMSGDLNSQIKNVQLLSGEWVTAAEAKKRFDMGSSITYDLTTRANVEQFRQANTLDTITWSDEQIMAFITKGGTIAQLSQMGVITPKPPSNMGFTNSGAINQATGLGYADGVTNAPGGWAMVGERGPERMYVPQGANILPNGSGGGAMVTVNVNVSGIMDARTQLELTRVVGDGLMKALTSIGYRAS